MNNLNKVFEQIDNLANGNSCPFLQDCHDFLSPSAHDECICGKNICPKHEMVRNLVLIEILRTLRNSPEDH